MTYAANTNYSSFWPLPLIVILSTVLYCRVIYFTASSTIL